MARRPLPGEFELIARYFAPLAAGAPGAFDLTDDVALVEVGPDEQLAVKTDAIVAGVHFLAGRSARPDRPQAAAREPLRPRRQGRAAARLSHDLRVSGRSRRGLAGDVRRRAGRRSARIRTLAPGRRHHRDAGTADAVGDRVRRHRQGPAALAGRRAGRRCRAGLGHARRRRARARRAAAGVSRSWMPPAARIWSTAIGCRGRACSSAVRSSKPGWSMPPWTSPTACSPTSAISAQTSKLGADIEWPRVPLSEPAAKLVAARPQLRERIVAGGDDYELLLTMAAAMCRRRSRSRNAGMCGSRRWAACARAPAYASSTSGARR